MRRLLLAPLLGFSACVTGGVTSVEGAYLIGVRHELDQAWVEHIDAAKNKDLAGTIRIYTDDILYVVSGAPEVRGIEAIERMEGATLASTDIVEARHESQDVQVVGDTAFELGTVSGVLRPTGADDLEVTFRYMALWVRGEDGEWRIRYMVGQV